MRQIRYEFYTEWCADKGQLYAQRHDFDSGQDARKAHGNALEFLWAGSKARPSVSDLYAITQDRDEATGRVSTFARDSIATGGTREHRQPKL